MATGTLDTVESNLEHQLRLHGAHRPEAFGGVIADPFVELFEFSVREAETPPSQGFL